MTDLTWLHDEDYPASPKPGDLLEFFGVPPSPESELDANIRKKRKHWRSKSAKARTDEAIRFTDAVLQAIAEAEDFLKRGADVDPAAAGDIDFDSGSARSTGGTKTIDDLWREIESLLFRGRYADALDRVASGQGQWGEFPRYRDMRSAVVLEVLQNGDASTLRSGVVDEAIADARTVLQQLGPSEPRYFTLIELLDAAQQTSEADRVFEEAMRELSDPSAEFRARRLTIIARQGDWDTILKLAIDLVNADPGDRALRSEIVQLLVARCKERLLPISSEADVALYRDVVNVAAWCAIGVPEAEDFVRAHRMWAANADQPIFAGNWQWRAFFAVITSMISLPIHNSLATKPAWKVLHAGPARIEEGERVGRSAHRKNQVANRAYFMATRNGYVEAVHDSVKLPWQRAAGLWVEVEPVFDF